MKYDEEEDKFTWDNPVVRSKKPAGTSLTTIAQAKALAKLKRTAKSQHRRDQCMECNEPPKYEVLWAEGMAHAWFCKKHFKEWISEENEEHTGGFTDIDYVKEVKDGTAAKKFSENPNPNIRDKLKVEFAKDWMNSPTFAYQVVHDKLPDTPLRGRTDSPKRMWGHKEVDKEFNDKWLEDLNSIPDIEIRATDIGHSSDRVAFVVFRFKDKKNDGKAKDIADSLNKLEGLYCKSDIGTEGRPRICVAGKIKLEDENWEKWWNSLAGKIKKVVEKEFEKAEEGGIDYVIGDTGKGVLQLHIMGIEEDKISELKKVSAEAVRSRANPTKLKMLLKGAIGEQGAHVDLRMVRKGDDYFEGGEIMIGNLTGLDKLKKLKEGGKLRFGWKVPRVEEPEAETIRGPVSWMKAGRNKIEIFPPGTVGATTNKYGAMLILDGFDWGAIEPQDKHAKKLKIKNTEVIPEGIYLFAYVPVTEAGKKGERVWMISKLKEEAETKKSKHYEFNKFIPIFDISKKADEHIVCGIVYAPNEVDSQGDTTTEEEIRKALYSYMEGPQKFKLNHKGKYIDAKVLEIYIAPMDFAISNQKIKKGSWLLIARVLDEKVWKGIKDGSITGYSLAGRAVHI
ncbi:hypothetical protein ES703_89397 [subsurface metagenome]